MEQTIRELTRAELEVMQIIWERGGALVSEVIEQMPEPKPATTTVSTIIRILEKKGFVSHTSEGRSFRYHPLVSREEYTNVFMSGVLSNFFGNSLSQLISFFAEKERITSGEMSEILEILRRDEQK